MATGEIITTALIIAPKTDSVKKNLDKIENFHTSIPQESHIKRSR